MLQFLFPAIRLQSRKPGDGIFTDSLPALGLAPGRAACATHSVHGIGNRSA